MKTDKIKNTIVVAGLLHDVGKIMQRGSFHTISHPLCSGTFVKEYLEKIAENFLDLELLKTLCERHHEGHYRNECNVEKISDESTRIYAYMISRADNYSSNEREEVDRELIASDYRKTKLLSIFSRVYIGRGIPNDHHYNLGSLYANPGFKTDWDYENLFNKFTEDIKKIDYSSYNSFLSGLINICENYLWCVPSDPRIEDQDISLYDHLFTTSGIASCLYDYHKNNLSEDRVKDDEKEKFVLIGGDLSGIQKFIFEIEQTNPKKLSKTLRGRSIYLSLLTEAVYLKIIKELDLSLTCKFIDAGGRFILLAPNSDEIIEKLKELEKEINKWFLKKFLGKLSLNIDYSVKLSGEDFKLSYIPKKISELNYNLEIKKKKSTYPNIVINSSDIFDKVYEDLQKNKACSFCGIYPNKEEERCEICLDAERIGDEINKRNFIMFSNSNDSIKIMDIGIKFVDEIEIDKGAYLVKKISDIKVDKIGYLNSHLRKYYHCYNKNDIAITDKDDIKKLKELRENKSVNLCLFCKELCERDERIENIKNESILSFQCIATSTLKNNDGKGVDHLGVLKADVDYLGVILSKGVENLSVSRLSSISRMLNFFFTYNLNEIIKNNFKMIYTVYAGGDDLLLIGPWEELINFSIKLQNDFIEYVSKNKNITISAGISFFRPKTSVKFAVEEVERNLEKSKNSGKDRLTIFGTTVEWEKINKLVEFKDFLAEEIKKEDSKINTSFLYRLLKYHNMFLDAEYKNRIEGLKFHSLASYDIRRNIEQRDNKGEIINRKTIEKLEKIYSTGENFDREIMKNLKIPIFWTLYKIRGG